MQPLAPLDTKTMSAFPTLSPKYHGAIEMAIAWQFVLLLSTALILDGGMLFRLSLMGAGAHWALILICLVRRPGAPTRLDLGFIRFGCPAFGVFLWGLVGYLGMS